jgi:hypothetical protein
VETLIGMDAIKKEAVEKGVIKGPEEEDTGSSVVNMMTLAREDDIIRNAICH